MKCDVAVIGGGPAGACAALSAARMGARVLLLHAELTPPRPVLERLAPRTLHLLTEMGESDAARACRATECPGVRSVWGLGAVHTARSILDPWGSGWVVQRARFDRWLRGQARAQGARLLAGRATAVTRTPTGWRIDVDKKPSGTAGGPCAVEAAHIVLATGRGRRLLRQLGSDTRCTAREVALLARLNRTPSAWAQDPLLLLESFDGGWGYGLSLSAHQALVGVVLSASSGALVDAITPALKTAALWRRAIGHTQLLREGAGQAPVAEVWAQPCPLTHATAFAGPGWVVAGDVGCAHAPLSGQGVGFAVESGWRAGWAASQALASDAASVENHAQWMQTAAAEHLATWRSLMDQGQSGPTP
ncbi:MAG: FAD-dependent oxidoreductase [Pseudomonadota bacterium]